MDYRVTIQGWDVRVCVCMGWRGGGAHNRIGSTVDDAAGVFTFHVAVVSL